MARLKIVILKNIVQIEDIISRKNIKKICVEKDIDTIILPYNNPRGSGYLKYELMLVGLKIRDVYSFNITEQLKKLTITNLLFGRVVFYLQNRFEKVWTSQIISSLERLESRCFASF